MTNQQVNVRPEQAADCAAVFAVNQRAFGQPDEAELIEALRQCASPLVSLVAELDGEIVGHILFSPVFVRPAATDESPGPAASEFTDAENTAMALGPMAVSPDSQKQGIGGLLIVAGLDACRALGENVVFVFGHADYYPRFGFERARKHGFWYKSEKFDPHFFVNALQDGALVGLSGAVEYHPEFNRF